MSWTQQFEDMMKTWTDTQKSLWDNFFETMQGFGKSQSGRAWEKTVSFGEEGIRNMFKTQTEGLETWISGLSAKTIRYYEDIGLVVPDRSANGYRDYGDQDIHRLTFLKRSRSLGFSIDECRLLLSLYEDKHRASSDVKAAQAAAVRRWFKEKPPEGMEWCT